MTFSKLTEFWIDSSWNGAHGHRVTPGWHIEYLAALKQVLDGAINLCIYMSVQICMTCDIKVA